jgi:hypothetical protein
MKKFNVIIAVCCIFAFFPGCASQMKKQVDYMEKVEKQPVNCQTAQSDIKALEAEKARVAERVIAGASSIMPISLVLGILTGTAKAKVKIATGKYNRMIDARIAKIKRECNLK